MFDIGFSELVIISVVALVVVGPERLPRLARTAGEWLGKIQRYVNDVKSDINRQMELEELRRIQGEVKSAAQNLESSFMSAVSDTEKEFETLSGSLTGEAGGSGQQTDWDRVYAVRRTRDRIRDRRIERERELGRKRPKRRLH